MPASKGRWWLTHDSQQIVIGTSPGRVYGLVSDLPRMGEWSPECERVEWADGSTVAAEGARFTGHNRGGPFRLMRWSRRGRVLAADSGREFAFVTEEGGRESTLWRYRFEPVEGGTRVTESYQVRWIPAWARMLDILTNRHRELREGMGHTLGQLKAAAEAPAGSPGSHDDAGEPALRPAAMTGLTVQRPSQPRRRSPMSTGHPATPAPIALQPTEGEALWFMGFLATIKATADGTAGRVAVIHHLGPQDAGSPLHVHHREDEWFYVLAGELTVWVGGQVIRAPAGSFVFGPQGTPHTFTVSSPDGASFLLVTEPGGFEAFMRTCAEPARSLTLPPPSDSPPDPAQLAALAAEYGIEIIGPPGIPA